MNLSRSRVEASRLGSPSRTARLRVSNTSLQRTRQLRALLSRKPLGATHNVLKPGIRPLLRRSI